ncbi:hypothetical protein EAO77_37590 [Streptomyces sp. t39]|nr:hypothetical protein EAO77_37590 [Streptomyces sp. t39]
MFSAGLLMSMAPACWTASTACSRGAAYSDTRAPVVTGLLMVEWSVGGLKGTPVKPVQSPCSPAGASGSAAAPAGVVRAVTRSTAWAPEVCVYIQRFSQPQVPDAATSRAAGR